MSCSTSVDAAGGQHRLLALLLLLLLLLLLSTRRLHRAQPQQQKAGAPVRIRTLDEFGDPLDKSQPAALHFKPGFKHPNQAAVRPQQQAVDAQGQFDQVQIPHSFGSVIQ
jgi:MYXO-CTERM domain-containing protein